MTPLSLANFFASGEAFTSKLEMESVEGKVLLDATGCCKIGVGTTGTSFTGAGTFVLTSSLIGFGLDSAS